jgi:tetratricopeptide (TPR) repeat protein
MLNKIDAQRFDQVRAKYDAGHYAQALEELLDLAGRVTDPWDKAELLYNEAIFLLEMKRIVDARQRVANLSKMLALLVKTPCDGNEFDAPVSLPVMARHADIRVTIEEGRKREAVQLIDDLTSRYPMQLSLAQFQTMSKEMKTMRGLLLVELGRWDEGKSFLEATAPPEIWKTHHRYCLGVCHYELGDFQQAKEKLSEAIALGLESSWATKAHFILGLAENKLSNTEAAKRQFELCLKSPDPKYVDMAEVWRGLEETSRALGLNAEAEDYRRLRTDWPLKSRIN